MKTPFKVKFASASLATFLLIASSSDASAQLSGNRTLGSAALSLSQQRSAASQATASTGIGALSALGQGGPKRYERGSRARGDFVGSNRTDLRGFVGTGQAQGVGPVRSSVENLRIETTRSANVNRPLPPQPAKGMYYPRLEVDLSSTTSQLESIPETPASDALNQRVADFSKGNANISLAGNVLILRGKVGSVREAELLEQLMQFEPGIDAVKNELEIVAR